MAPDKDHGITAKIVCLINVDTDEETGNAWRNEILAVKAFLTLAASWCLYQPNENPKKRLLNSSLIPWARRPIE